jgi:hypothetical protein
MKLLNLTPEQIEDARKRFKEANEYAERTKDWETKTVFDPMDDSTHVVKVNPETRYWIYFRGTSNGEFVEAATLKTAKVIFARKHNLPDNSAYIAGTRFKK